MTVFTFNQFIVVHCGIIVVHCGLLWNLKDEWQPFFVVYSNCTFDTIKNILIFKRVFT